MNSTSHSSSLLPIGVWMNAGLSLVVGALLTIAPDAVDDRLALDISAWLRALGIALLGHAAVLGWVARRDRPERWVRLNLAIVAPYPVAMLAIAASSVVEPAGGKALLVLDGAAVAVVAVLQWSGLRQQRRAAATLPA